MHQKHLFRTRKGDGGFRQPAQLAYRARRRHPWAVAGLAGLRDDAPSHRSATSAAGVEGAGGTFRGVGGRRRGRAGRRADAPSQRRAARTARGRAAAHRHTQRPGPPAPDRPWAHKTARPHGSGRLSQYQRLIAGSRQCRGLRGHSPGERWKYRAWRQYPSRFPPCGDPRRRRWRSAWSSRQRSRRRCPRSQPGSGSEPAGPRNLGCRCR